MGYDLGRSRPNASLAEVELAAETEEEEEETGDANGQVEEGSAARREREVEDEEVEEGDKSASAHSKWADATNTALAPRSTGSMSKAWLDRIFKKDINCWPTANVMPPDACRQSINPGSGSRAEGDKIDTRTIAYRNPCGQKFKKYSPIALVFVYSLINVTSSDAVSQLANDPVHIDGSWYSVSRLAFVTPVKTTGSSRHC